MMKIRYRVLFACVAISLRFSIAALAVPVKCGDHTLGNISWSDYEVRYGFGKTGHTGERQDTDTWGGANLDASFTFDSCPPDMELRPGLEFRWIQIITTTDPPTDPCERGTAPTDGYVDPWVNPNTGWGWEDHEPFYWTDDQWENNYWNADTKTLTFADRSRRSFSNAPVEWEAALNLVCTWETNIIHVLGHLIWGWDMADQPNPDVTLDPATLSWTAGASANLETIVCKETEFGDDWTFTDECCCIPEPGTVVLLGFGGLALIRRRRG